MYINSILSIEATFVNITFQSSKQEDLKDTLPVRLSHTRENRSNSRSIFEKVSYESNNITASSSRQYHAGTLIFSDR